MVEDVRQLLAEQFDQDLLFADGFDQAILGVDSYSNRVVYSVRKCIEVLIEDDMSEQDAIEYFEYNVQNAYVGPKTPIWCDDQLVFFNTNDI